MSTVQRVAQVFGVIFVLIGIVGFFYAPGMEMGMLLGIFPVNLLHNVVHVLLGVWGIMAARSFAGAKSYAQLVGLIYLVLALVGFMDPTGFGLVPLGETDVWLHAVLGIVLGYFGVTAKGGEPSVTAA